MGVTVFPPTYPLEEVVRHNPSLTVISNGPGAPGAAPIGDLAQIHGPRRPSFWGGAGTPTPGHGRWSEGGQDGEGTPRT